MPIAKAKTIKEAMPVNIVPMAFKLFPAPVDSDEWQTEHNKS
jgi:hypothetical protein